jgi:hypothetical protein
MKNIPRQIETFYEIQKFEIESDEFTSKKLE